MDQVLCTHAWCLFTNLSTENVEMSTFLIFMYMGNIRFYALLYTKMLRMHKNEANVGNCLNFEHG